MPVCSFYSWPTNDDDGDDNDDDGDGGDDDHCDDGDGGRYKVIVGSIRQAGWCGQVHPNLTKPWDAFDTVLNCTDPAINKTCCLFDVLAGTTDRQMVCVCVCTCVCVCVCVCVCGEEVGRQQPGEDLAMKPYNVIEPGYTETLH